MTVIITKLPDPGILESFLFIYFFNFFFFGGGGGGVGGGSTQATAIIKYLLQVYHEREVKKV